MAQVLTGGVNYKTLGLHSGHVNPRDYGAKSNDVYDNQGVVQAIIDAMELQDGGCIEFPPSQEGLRYRFLSSVVNDSLKTVSFRGLGTSGQWPDNQAKLWLDSDTDNACLIKYANVGALSGGQIVERLAFSGNDDTDGLGANQSAILFAGRCNMHNIRECGFQFFSGYAIAHDPTVAATYHQNSSLRNLHFYNVGGMIGPTVEYPDAGGYIFANLYTMENLGLDIGTGWASWGHTAKPHIMDLRAVMETYLLGNLLFEGANQSVTTSCIALALGNVTRFGNIWLEIVANTPTYLLALYGNGTTKFGSSTEKNVYIQKCGGRPIWFQNHATNEVTVKVEEWVDYDADTIGEIVVWEDGVSLNESGNLDVGIISTKTMMAVSGGITDAYKGRFVANTTFMDVPMRYRLPVSAQARKLFSWNPSQGSPFRKWGEGSFEDDATASTWTIEADGDFLCLRGIGKSAHASKFPRWTWRFGAGFGLAESYAGAMLTLAVRYRAIIDPADSPKTPTLAGNAVATGWANYAASIDHQLPNRSDYVTAVWCGILVPFTGTEVYQIQVQPSSNLTVVGEYRILCFEAWLGVPTYFDLEPASVVNPVNGIPTFAASDATPSVGGSKTWKTDTGGLTITDLDNFPSGEEVTIISKGVIVFDTTGTNLVGSSTDITTASGDITKWVSEDGTTKRLVGFVDVSIDNSAGA